MTRAERELARSRSPHCRAVKAAWKAANPEKVKASVQAWHDRNRARINARARQRTPEERRAERARAAAKGGLPYQQRLEAEVAARKEARAVAKAMRAFMQAIERGMALTRIAFKQLAGTYRCESDAAYWRARYRSDSTFRRREIQRLKAQKLKRKGLMVPGVSHAEVDALYRELMRCPYCDGALDQGNTTLDHMHPLSKGGLHHAPNLIACCRSCNVRKASKGFDRWVTSLPEGQRIVVAEVLQRRSDAAKRAAQ